MKKIVTLIVVLIASVTFASAQRFGYIDTEYVMSQIPDYQSAQAEIEDASEKWQEELEKMYQNIERMYSEYQAGEVLMTEETREERQEEIFQAERLAKEFREEKFGQNGEIFQLQEEKIRPIQEEIFQIVEQIAKAKRMDFVFDKAGEVTWLYTNAAFDISNDVLAEMGLKVEEANNNNR